MIEIEGIKKIKIKLPDWKILLFFIVVVICVIRGDYLLIIDLIKLI